MRRSNSRLRSLGVILLLPTSCRGTPSPAFPVPRSTSWFRFRIPRIVAGVVPTFVCPRPRVAPSHRDRPLAPQASSGFDEGASEEIKPSTPPDVGLGLSLDEEIDAERRASLRKRVLVIVPVLSTASAFFTFDFTWRTFHDIVENSSENFNVVDGGLLQAQSLSPVINGPVLASVGLLFATMVSMTVSNLYDRQMTVRSCLFREIEELRYVQQLLRGFPPEAEDERIRLKIHVDRYTETLFQRNVLLRENDPLKAMGNTSLRDLVYRLNELTVAAAAARHTRGDAPPTSSTTTAVVTSPAPAPDALLSQLYDAVTRMKAERARRINAKSSTFPPTHYVMLTLLASMVCVAFLMEANHSALFFLDNFQLRVCWSALIGTYASMAAVVYDLESFDGYYATFGAEEESIMIVRRYARNED